MRKNVLVLLMVLLGLLTGVNTAWAEDEAQTIYLGSLKAQSSATSTGSGQVRLTWLDIKGTPIANTDFVGEGKLNTVNPTAFGETAQLYGGTLFAVDGVEVPVEIQSGTQIYMTSCVYFLAEAQPAKGSYLAGWTFTDAAVTALDTLGDASGGDYFKLLPDTANNATYPVTSETYAAYTATLANVTSNPNNIYAVFKKYLLSNSTATSGSLEAVAGYSANLTVTVDVEGDLTSLNTDMSDFGTPSFTDNDNNQWSYNLEGASTTILSSTKVRISIPVTFTAQSDITAGEYKTTMTVSMAGENPSTLSIILSVNALDSDRPEAYWYDGKTEQASGSLSEMLATDISGYTTPILKINKPVEDALTFSGKDFTLDLNGNTAQDITINSGNVTIAYSKYGGSAEALTVNGGTVVLNGGTFASLIVAEGATVEQNGAVISGAATNYGTLTTTDGTINGGLTSSGTLTLNGGTFNGEYAITISGGTATINKGTITGTTYGIYATNGTITIAKLAVITGGTNSVNRADGGTVTVNCGKFGAPLTGTLDFVSGYFKTNNYGIDTTGLGKTELLVSAGTEYNEGYRYFLGTAESAIANGAGVCRIGTTSYVTLEDALAYANNNPDEELVIFMTNDYTLPAGYYTLPAKATLVVPMSDSQEKEVNTNTPRVSFHDMDRSHPYVQPSEFRRLTFASGVNMDVFGDIELTCTQFASNEAYTSQPYGPYGRLVMEEGSHMTLQSGSELRAWGFMTGKGETDARRGAKVREMFQLGDWKGAMTSVKITGMAPSIVADDSQYKIFPVSQYFIQNVESPVKYHPGAVLSTSATVAEGLMNVLAVTMTAADIKIVGVSGTDQAIFLMDIAADADNTWVRKWYDAENDVQTYEINSGAHIGSMVLDMGTLSLMGYNLPVKLNSAKFDLPITSSMKIHLLSGTMDFEQNTSLLPGAEVEVDKESVVSVAMSDEEQEWRDANKDTVYYTGALYVYDADNWGRHAYCNVAYYNGSEWVSQKDTAYTKIVRYAASWDGTPTIREEMTKPADAAIDVHGTFNTLEGYVYTSAGGANIFSSNTDAGTFIFNQAGSGAGERAVNQVKDPVSNDFASRNTHIVATNTTFTCAQLKNGTGISPEYAETSAAEAGDAYCYIDDKWTILKVDEDDNCFMVDNYGTFYAKPQEYVAITATKDGEGYISGNSDHTFSDAAGAGRLFILMSNNCQWWEVENVNNLYHCIHPDNDTYYYWDEINEEWAEKKFTITWKNWDGTIIQTTDADGNLVDNYEVTYGTQAEFLGTNPTREATIDYTYDFTGWSPELGIVTSDVTYTATYTTKERKYTIIFCQEGGTEIERQFLTHNAVPVCENTPVKTGYTLEWSPAIAAVTGDATYTATWLEEPPTEYEITFYDYDGTTVLQQGNVAVGATPTAPANPSGKLATSEYTYVFDHWSPTIETVSTTSAKSYTAVYSEVAKTYTISYFKEDGTTPNPTKASESLAYGATPTPPTVTKEDPEAGHTYSLVWKSLDESSGIQTVIGDASYKPTYQDVLNKHTVTLVSSVSGACTFTGAGVYDYGTSVTITAIPATGYEFVKWQETDVTTANLPAQTITADITLTAVVQPIVVSSDLEIPSDGDFTLGTSTAYENLIITSNGVSSGQLRDPENLTLTGDAYFDITSTFAARTWYAVAVPWEVDATSGIFANGVVQGLGTTFDLLYYDGAERAANGPSKACWKYVEFEENKTMQPGRLYMIYLANSASTLRFQKKAGSDLQTTSLNVSQYTSGTTADAGWNGIANPALYYAYLNANASTYSNVNFGQKYVPVEDRYALINMSENALIVGQPVFVQVPENKTVGAYTTWSEAVAHAPHRKAIVDNSYYEVQIAAEGNVTDNLYVQTMEDKEDEYVIGLDLAKAGVSTKVAQMWVDRYNTKLCVNTTAPVGSSASYPLGIFAPQDGDYRIYPATEMQGDQEMYVTRDGKVIWNLAYGPYTLSLSAGNHTQYGLKIVQAPAVTTDVDQTSAEQPAFRKVLIDNKVYILREGEVYTVTGQKVQ